jgi:4-hydroxybenzoate polyprenyltransferase
VKTPHPLIVDLDGSLLRTDSLHESVAAALVRPSVLATAVGCLARSGKAALKRHLASKAPIDVALLPVNEDVLAFIESQRLSGRPVYLATGADASVAEQVLSRFPSFEGAFSSDGRINLTGERKAELLVREFGREGFDYVGNSREDLAVWKHANRSHLVSKHPEPQLPRWARGVTFDSIIREASAPKWRVWLKELRVHQSLKNVLLFLPILAAHEFVPLSIALLIGGFFAFTLMASSVYLLNDLLDLTSDRMHARKSRRPLAAGRILPLHALVASFLLAVAALTLAAFVGVGFTLVLVLYAILTCLYSFWLKRIALVDVTILAMLYMIRILAGAVIADISLSFWFTSVALFLFISLALVKRYTELAPQLLAEGNHALPGRGYTRPDTAIVLPLGIASGIAVLLLMAIYLQSDAVAVLYPSEVFLWLVIPVMFYWIGNMWMQAGRGAMHDDPIVFALKNPASLASGLVIASLFVAASSPIVEIFQIWISPMVR